MEVIANYLEGFYKKFIFKLLLLNNKVSKIDILRKLDGLFPDKYNVDELYKHIRLLLRKDILDWKLEGEELYLTINLKLTDEEKEKLLKLIDI